MVTNSSDCIQKVRVPEGCCTDISSNQNILGSKEININRTVPVVTIEPNGSNGTVKNINIKITASSANTLKSNNEYQYCLTTNETLQGNEEWTTYTSDIPFTIGTGLNGTYYIHTKVIYDIAGNYSEAVKSNPFVFDNTAPEIGAITGSGNGSNITLKSTVTDSVGVTGYAITTNTEEPTEWTDVESTTSWSASVPTTNTGAVYLHVKDNAGNANYDSVNICKGTTNYCNSARLCTDGFSSYTFTCTFGHQTATTTILEFCPSCGQRGKNAGGSNTCAHGYRNSHWVSCSHNRTSAHYYCPHNTSAVYHIY